MSEDDRTGHHQKRPSVHRADIIRGKDSRNLTAETPEHRCALVVRPVRSGHDGSRGRTLLPRHDKHRRSRTAAEGAPSGPYTLRVDIRTDNPVGKVPDLRRTRRARLYVDHAGWTLDRMHGRWTVDGVEHLLPELDSTHALHWAGEVRTADAALFAHFIHRAVARGTFVSGPMDARTAVQLPPALASLVPAIPQPGEVG